MKTAGGSCSSSDSDLSESVTLRAFVCRRVTKKNFLWFDLILCEFEQKKRKRLRLQEEEEEKKEVETSWRVFIFLCFGAIFSF